MNDDDLPTLVAPQKWLLWLAGAVLAVAGLGLFFPDAIDQLFGIDAVTVRLGALLLTFVTLAFTLFAIRCPHCGLRLVMYAMSRRGVGEWLQWLLTVKTCPRCGVPGNEKKLK